MLWHMTQSRDHIDPTILIYDKLPRRSIWQIYHPALRHLDFTSLLNARPFKCFDLLADQTLTEVTIVNFLFNDEFRELVIQESTSSLGVTRIFQEKKVVARCMACWTQWFDSLVQASALTLSTQGGDQVVIYFQGSKILSQGGKQF